MTVKVSKTVVDGENGQEFYYINLLNFKDVHEQEEIYFKIKDLLEEHNGL